MGNGIPAIFLFAALAHGQPFAGSEACAGCHREIYDRYRRTPMGRSMSPATAHLAKAAAAAEVNEEKLRRRFSVFVSDGRLMQAEAGEGFRAEHEVAYAIGSGMHGFSFVVKRGDHLFQAPLSYYTRNGRWELSPGYEFADYGFNRPIATACIACHSGRPQLLPQRAGQYREPPFLELSIGCENCHGPGREHAVRRRGRIVNPAKLPAALAEDICMNCHQGGDTRIAQPGKTELDFRPGRPLNETVAIFRIPRAAGDPRDADLLEHHESMRLSKCYRQSAGKLTCLTCHSPHGAATKATASTCVSCHKEVFAARPSHPRPGSNCIECHMPKREAGVIAHTALTNHRIVRTAEQGLPPEAFAQTTADLPDLVHMNGVPGQKLPTLTLMRAYGQLSDKQPAYLARFQTLLDQAARESPKEPLVLASLGRRALRAGQGAEAIDLLRKAIAAGSEASTTYEDLGEALSRGGDLDAAVTVLRRGLELAPYTQTLHKSLALRYIKLQRYAEAKQALERYVELFPEDDFVRKLLAQVSSAR